MQTTREPEAVSEPEAALFLAEHLGRPLLARTVGVTRRTLANWLAGRADPSPRSLEQLHVTLAIWETVATIEAPEVVRAWFMTMQDALDDYSPTDMIAAGRAADVVAVARVYVQRS
jgi:transcriptional regulator with XRE-family HTH domain